MKSKKTPSAFFLIAVTGAAFLVISSASAADNALAFHGRLVNGGCDARILDTPNLLQASRSLKVSASLTLALVDHDDACEGAAIPVSMAYVERASVALDAHNGIVTLTYQ